MLLPWVSLWIWIFSKPLPRLWTLAPESCQIDFPQQLWLFNGVFSTSESKCPCLLWNSQKSHEVNCVSPPAPVGLLKHPTVEAGSVDHCCSQVDYQGWKWNHLLIPDGEKVISEVSLCQYTSPIQCRIWRESGCLFLQSVWLCSRLFPRSCGGSYKSYV